MNPVPLFFTSLGVAFLSGFLPFVNIEAYLLGMVLGGATQGSGAAPNIDGSLTGSLVLVVAATMGQMAAKCLLYFSARGLVGLPLRKRRIKGMEELRERLSRRRVYSTGLMFVSALTGLPPFYAISVLAGTVRIPFVLFLPSGSAGRLLRFALFVWAPQLMMNLRAGG